MTSSIGKPVTIAGVLLILALSAVAQWSEPSAEEIIVRGGWLFDGVSDTRRQNTGIVIRDGEFA